ncbi:hypothetical protein GS415_09725 [Rhodococcus hoagii]|nr:hypothetical protein [Prescottella equi]
MPPRPQGYNHLRIGPNAYTAILDAQNGRCYICPASSPSSASPRRRPRPHLLPRGGSCGQCVRALLCSPCNRLLGHLRDNTDALHRAITVIRDRPAQAVLNALDTKDHQ